MFLPDVKIDAITLALLLIAVLPWLGFIFKSVELPGGLKVEYPALEKASEDAAKVGLLSRAQKREESTYLAIAEEDPNLALAGLRIEIERRLREIAKRRGLVGERLGVGQLLQLLRTHGEERPFPVVAFGKELLEFGIEHWGEDQGTFLGPRMFLQDLGEFLWEWDGPFFPIFRQKRVLGFCTDVEAPVRQVKVRPVECLEFAPAEPSREH